MSETSRRSAWLRAWMAGAASALLLIGGAAAQPKPSGPVVLSVAAHVGKPDKVAADFDMAALERLPQFSYTTATPWYGQPTKFTGPLMRDVLTAAGAEFVTGRQLAVRSHRVGFLPSA